MAKDCGITLYFRHDCINIRKGTIEVLDWPDYVYLYVNRNKKQLFIQSSTRNKDAFRVYYKLGEQEKREEKSEEKKEEQEEKNEKLEEQGKKIEEKKEKAKKEKLERFYVNAKPLLDDLAKVVGVGRQSESLRYSGELLPDGKTVYIDLNNYEVIPYAEGQ